MATTSLQQLAGLEQNIGSADWSRWTRNRYVFYDYVQLPPTGTTDLQFFSVPYGQNDPTTNTLKTLEQTNCPEQRSFGRVNYLISQIRTHIRVVPKTRQVAGISGQASVIYNEYGALMNVLHDLSLQGTLIITLGQKEYFDINQPFLSCPPGFGANILQFGSNTGGTATQSLWFQQQNRPDAVYRVKPEQLVEAGQTFIIHIAFDNGLTPVLTNLVNSATPKVEIGVIFDGYILRPVQ